MLSVSIYLLGFLISMAIYILFYSLSYKILSSNDELTPFECGYTSFSQSNFTFSIHYLLFIFLFLLLDLEFTLTFWYFYSSTFSNYVSLFMVELFLMLVLLSLVYEWYSSKLDWTY